MKRVWFTPDQLAEADRLLRLYEATPVEYRHVSEPSGAHMLAHALWMEMDEARLLVEAVDKARG